MKRLLSVVLFIVFLPLLAMAQSDFEGAWKVDLTKSGMPDKADVFLLQNGTYQCKTCVPPINVKADGEDHGISGNPYYDAVAVKILDDRSIETTEKKNGRIVATSKMVVSADGNTAAFEFTDSCTNTPELVVGKGIMTRVAKTKRPPAASHVISGSWRTSKIESLSDNALGFTFKVEGDSLNMTIRLVRPTRRNWTGQMRPTKAIPVSTRSQHCALARTHLWILTNATARRSRLSGSW
jgi:hypothetical protein